ncbi:hypothetical protein [Flavobacterium psychrotolerans]|uniref:Uncharacterized protein n=1 Tax=Flavobacterium psychrotolerans TaxID=2169410 RepID=A0A2U1JK83_9FLAO|nr:hypothetical protein [Flavobacterium psychrotolerans]PWA05415.1 hypothetical protein DB895_07410 [Flavobacterium psychrotolerans]
MKSQDYLPHSEAEQAIWLTSFKTNLATQGAAVGLVAAQITTTTTSANNIIVALNDVETKRVAYNQATTQKETVKKNELKTLRDTVAKIKTNSGYTEAIGKSLGIVGGVVLFDALNYKATITAERFAGYIRIKFTKNGTDGINLYHRKKGEVAWQFLARDTKSPYDDHITLETAGQPEHWEYRAYGVIDDAEIGQASDIIEMVFGG